MLLRLYGIDPRADVSQPELEPWGYVPPTRVSARVLGCVKKQNAWSGWVMSGLTLTHTHTYSHT